ncbi:MAG: nucleotide-binding domain containing protein [Bradyrhizobium sp.]
MASDGSWRAAGANILGQLRQQNVEARLGSTAGDLQPGVSVFDADADEDLHRVVQIGRRYSGRVLWCGSGGLAGALASQTGVSASRKLKTPILGMFGSDHPATAAQLARCQRVVVSGADGNKTLDQIKRALARGVAFLKLDARCGHSRAEAAQCFELQIAAVSKAIDPPGTLIVAGGETLKAQCLAVGASALQVLGRLEPGVARSAIQDGAWMGVDVISKSGAFGQSDLWWNLLNENGLIQEGM